MENEFDYKEFHDIIMTFDAHADIREAFGADLDHLKPDLINQIDLQKLQKGKVDIVNITLSTPTLSPSAENYKIAEAKFQAKYDAVKKWVKNNAEQLDFVYNSVDFERVAFSKKNGVILSFQNAFWFDKVEKIDELYKNGIRIFAFNFLGNNAFAGSSRPIPAFGDANEEVGLTTLGKQAVKKLNDLGIVIDVSQSSKKATLEIVEASRHPVIASHSGVKGKVDHIRNLSDEELKAIAAKGGIVHINAFADYLNPNALKRTEAIKNLYHKFGLKYGKDQPSEKLKPKKLDQFNEAYLKISNDNWKNANLKDFIDSVDYAVKLIGADHVGLSSDFNHGGGVQGFADASEAENITKELFERGYSQADIRKLWGRNFFFILDKIERDSANNPWGISK